MDDHRGITLISVFAKWYMGCVVWLLRKFVQTASTWRWRRLLIFGFEEHHSTEQICVGLQLLVSKGREWPSGHPIVVLSADVKAAFDELDLDAVLDCLCHWNFPGELIAALVEESLELEAEAMLHGVRSKTFPFTRSVRQGGVESTFEWNLVVRRMLDSCYDRWQAAGYGVRLPVVGLINHVVWADNLYFIGHSIEHVVAMAQDITDCLLSLRMRWKPSSLQL